MDTDTNVAKPASRHGMAMFIVLGAIVLVTLFGYVGITLAGRDQTLSGDLNDIKSRDEAAVASLQFAINRLLDNPTRLVGILNTFDSLGRVNGGQPSSTWLVFGASTNTVTLQKKEPNWFKLTPDATNQSAMKLQILGVGAGDSTIPVTDKKDSLGVYVSFRGLARGRRGDEKEVLAAYRLHGISVNYRRDTTFYTIPRHSFYLGGDYASPNMGLSTTGDVYIGGTGDSYMNSGANHILGGDLQFNANMRMNKGNPLTINGNLYVPGWLKNNGDSLNVNGNAWIGGFDVMDDPGTVYVKGNLHLHTLSTGAATDVWNSTKGLRVDGNLVYYPFNARIPKKIVVGGDAWFVRGTGGFDINTSDSFYVGRNLYFGQPAMDHRYVFTGTGLFKVGSSLYHAGPVNINTYLTLPGGVIGQGLKVDQKLTIAAGRTLSVGTNYQIGNLALGAGASITGTSGTPAGAWVAPPTDVALGLNPAKMNTQPEQNPMDSVKTPPDILASAIPLAPLLSSGKLTGARLTAVYDSLKTAGSLYNDYMILRHRKGDGSLDANDGVSTFTGKMMVIIEEAMTINGNWPASSSLASIQVILIRRIPNGTEVSQFGWPDTLAGIISWENPCGGRTFKITRGYLYGALLLGTTLTAEGYGYTASEVAACTPSSLTTNTGDLNVIRDLATFEDIGRNLPNVLMPALDVAGHPISTRSTVFQYRKSPILRLVHDRPYFEPIGVFR